MFSGRGLRQLKILTPIDAPKLPAAPGSIQKGVPLKGIVSDTSVSVLAQNIWLVDQGFDRGAFRQAVNISENMSLMERADHVATVLFAALDRTYEQCIDVLIASLTPVLSSTSEFGLSGFFYLPHSAFISRYGLDPIFNSGRDPFHASIRAQYELTQRFTAEFCVRPFLLSRQEETIAVLKQWVHDASPHVRRLCSEGTRPRLPWGKRLKSFDLGNEDIMDMLEVLMGDTDRYVTRSVANHLGDLCKSNLPLVLATCDRWLSDASREQKWLIRHALRYPAKKGNAEALTLRKAAR